jgi:hypothetical protein
MNYAYFQSGTSFDPIPQDEALWNSSNPLSTIISISIALDDGNVVCSDFQSCCWVFTTLQALWKPFTWKDGVHPVSGNRQFGISDAENHSASALNFAGFVFEVLEETFSENTVQ